MELTRRCDYAFRILRSAYRHQDNYVSIAEVAEEELIPYAFARTIQHELATAGYLRTVRGAKGGLVLDCKPEDVTLLDVMHALQGPLDLAACVADPDSCPMVAQCTINRVWIAADKVLESLLAALTLQDVFEGTSEGEFLADARAQAESCVTECVDDILSGHAPFSCGAIDAPETE